MNSENNFIDWSECESMHFSRNDHFTIYTTNKIIVIGGWSTYHIEYFDGNKWTLGPKIPFRITTCGAQCIYDSMGRVLIVTYSDGLIVFDVEKETYKQYQNYGLKEMRRNFNATLQ